MAIDTADPELHRALLTRASTKLGRMHWYLLRAGALFHERVWERNPESGRRFVFERPRLTPFGQIAGVEPIHWWVARCESDLEGFERRTLVAYRAAQPLFKAAGQLLDLSSLPKRYADLVERLASFVNAQEPRIAVLLDYAQWLASRDALAPAILFSHEVWPTTHLANRTIDLRGRGVDDEALLAELTLIVLGVRDYGGFTVDLVYNEIAFALYDSMGEHAPPDVSDKQVVPKAAYRIFEAFQTYLQKIRDSLRAIARAVERQRTSDSILYDDAFWRAFVAKARAQPAEEQRWDFKEALPFWDAPSRQARDRGKDKFREQVAAFANTTGGVFVVGVRDGDRAVVGIPDLEDKLKFTREVLDEFFPIPDLAMMRQMSLAGEDGRERPCVVLVIRQTAEAVVIDRGAVEYCPVRKETGLARVSPAGVRAEKQALRLTNHRFLFDLKRWVES